MDHGYSVLIPEHQHAASALENPRLLSVDVEGRVSAAAGCGIEDCDGDTECPFLDTQNQLGLFHERLTERPSCYAQRLKSFNFERRRQSPSREARRFSASASPRTRHPPMYLSSFPSIGIPLDPSWTQDNEPGTTDRSRKSISECHTVAKPRHSQSWPAAEVTTALASFGVNPLLTPPEDSDDFTWTVSPQPSTPSRQESSSSDVGNQGVAIQARNSSDRSTERPSTITLPLRGVMQGEGSPSTWSSRAVQTIVSIHSELHPNAHLNMVAQTMPPHTERSLDGSKLVFEEVVQSIQQFSTNVPYVTITHAYTDRTTVSLGEIPDSPPATPNTQDGSDYFDNNTIFTHAAKVPDYHRPNTTATAVGRNPKVAAPSTVNVSTLERYIPPTTAAEVNDFFSLSRRSHLVDRLSELTASQNGTLLLVYPTKTGGQTFARWYKNPILDPLIRQFMLLRGLTTPFGYAVGRLDSVDSLMGFDQMQAALEQLCSELAPQLPPIGGRSEFSVIHAEKADVILNRQTWIELFLAQESPRMRQDLIDYQKSGQRMPAEGFEQSPAALAREVEDGIRSSKEHAGGIGIEVGVFVIKRFLI